MKGDRIEKGFNLTNGRGGHEPNVVAYAGCLSIPSFPTVPGPKRYKSSLVDDDGVYGKWFLF